MFDLPFLKGKERPIYLTRSEHWLVGPDVMDAWLLLISSLLRSIAILVLSLALCEQVKHRTEFPKLPELTNETTPLIRRDSTESINSRPTDSIRSCNRPSYRSNSLHGRLFRNEESNEDVESEPDQLEVVESVQLKYIQYIKKILGSWKILSVVTWIFRVIVMLTTLYS